MTATPHELLRYRVTGSRPDTEYLVDLASFAGNGRCNCTHFRIRLEPAIRTALAAGPFTATDATRCKHIIACRHHLTDATITTFRHQFGNNDDD